MDRREVLKASLASAAAMGISAKSEIPSVVDSRTKLHASSVTGEIIARSPLVNLYDFEAAAKRKLSEAAWEYFNGGSADEITLRRNRQALDALQLKPRVLVDVTRIDTSCTLLGYRMEHPILLAPTSSHLLAHPDAETATARGAASAKTIMVASTVSNRSIEDICKAASEPIWFQLYVEDDRSAVRALIERAEAAGCKALVSLSTIRSPTRETGKSACAHWPRHFLSQTLGLKQAQAGAADRAGISTGMTLRGSSRLPRHL